MNILSDPILDDEFLKQSTTTEKQILRRVLVLRYTSFYVVHGDYYFLGTLSQITEDYDPGQLSPGEELIKSYGEFF